MPLRRNIVSISILFLAGILLAGLSPIYPPLWVLLSILALLSISLVVAQFHQRKTSKPFSNFLLSILFTASGCLYSLSYQAFHPNLVTAFYDRNIVVSGVVDDIPVYLNDKWQYTVSVQQIKLTDGESHEVQLADRIRISDARHSQSAPAYGDRVQIRGALLEPTPARNPGGYDDQLYLARQGIHGRVSVRNEHELVKTGTDNTLYGWTIAPLQVHIWTVLKRLFPTGEAELTGGLVIGFKADLPEEWKDAFQLLSITHILAASGMNVGLISAAMFYLCKRCRIPKRFATPIVAVIIAVYVLLAGAGPSVVRAGLMALLIIMGLSLRRKTDILTSVSLAALISVLWNPAAASDVGFMLSFVTTLGLFLLTPKLERRFPGPAWLRTALAVTAAAQISSLPILIYFFNVISPLSYLANLYIMPLTFLLVPLGFALIILGVIHPWLAMPFAPLYRVLLWLLVKPVIWIVQKTNGWAWTIGSPPSWVIWAIYAGLLLIITRRHAALAVHKITVMFRHLPKPVGYAAQSFGRQVSAWRTRLNRSRKLLLGTGLGLCLLLVMVHAWPAHQLRVTFVDVGQGDCALIEGPRGTKILVDGGGIPSYLHSDFDVGEKIVLPFLRHRGVRTLDYVVATHADEDHVRGLLSVLKRIKVRNLVVSGYDDPAPAFQELLRAARFADIPIYREQSGTAWVLEEGLSWRFLYPDAIHTGTRSDTNANSVVFELDYGSRSFLFTGDIEGEVEGELIAHARHVDVLKVAHHGSEYSTTEQFLQHVRPQYAIISAGKRNQYGHPHQATLNRLRQVGAKIYRTDQQGAITVRTDGTQLQIDTEIR